MLLTTVSGVSENAFISTSCRLPIRKWLRTSTPARIYSFTACKPACYKPVPSREIWPTVAGRASSAKIKPKNLRYLFFKLYFSSSNREMYKRQLLPSGLIPMYLMTGVTVTSLTSCTSRLAELRIY